MPVLDLAITRAVSPEIAHCELTFIDREPIDYHLAVEQHERYCALLSECGLEVIVLPADDRYPDCTFVEDTAVVFDEVAIITRMGTTTRQGEEAAMEPVLAQYRPIVKVQPPATIDGGDVLRLDRTVFVGLSPRTNVAAVEVFRRILNGHGYRVRPVQVTGCLHLKSACTAIDEETVLVNPQWADVEPFSDVRIIPVPEDEPRAAEVLRLGDAVCMHVGFPRTRALVESLNVTVHAVNLSEFVKAEAGPTCLSILLSRTEPVGNKPHR